MMTLWPIVDTQRAALANQRRAALRGFKRAMCNSGVLFWTWWANFSHFRWKATIPSNRCTIQRN